MSLVPYRASLRPRALRPQLKRDPLGRPEGLCLDLCQ